MPEESDHKPKKEQVEKTESSNEKPPQKKFYKKAWFWLTVVLGVLAVGLGVFLIIYFGSQSTNKKTVTSGWADIVRQSNVLGSIGEGVNDKDSFDKYNVELQRLNSVLKDKKINAKKLSFKGQDVQRYEKFLEDFGTYVNSSSEFATKINDYTEADNDKLKLYSLAAKESSDSARSNIKYLNESMPDAAFKIQDILTSANKFILAKELSIQAEQKAAEAQSAKDRADKTAVENATGNYLNAFIAGNAATMRRYMSSAFQAEYDFNQISDSARAIVYPASFRILNVVKVDGSKYKTQANVLYKYRDGSGQYTVGDELNLIYDNSSAAWLVNSVREGSAY